MQKNLKYIGFVSVALIVVVAGVFIFSGKDTKRAAGEYDTFAQCLYDSGMRMYGSVTCKFCEQQRKMFGPSFELIREIECDPRNANPETERCVSKKITHTPTWIHEDENGETIFAFKSGVIPLEELAEKSGCPLVKDDIQSTEG